MSKVISGRANIYGIYVHYKGIHGILEGDAIHWSDGDDIYTAHSFAEYRVQVDAAYKGALNGNRARR